MDNQSHSKRGSAGNILAFLTLIVTIVGIVLANRANSNGDPPSETPVPQETSETYIDEPKTTNTPIESPVVTDDGLVYIRDLEPVETGYRELRIEEIVKDFDGNQYYYGLTGAHQFFLDAGYVSDWNKYYIDQKYSTFKCKFVLTSMQYPDSSTPNFKIYGDDDLIYSAELSKTDVKPIEIEVDVSGVSLLKIDMDCYDKGDALSSGKYVAYIVDATLEK